MKSENVILISVLLFASIMIGGLTVQSCKSSKVDRTTHAQADSSGRSKHDKTKELDSLLRVIKVNKWSLSFRNDVYIPVMDSAGRVTGSVLIGSNSGVMQQEERSDSAVSRSEKSTDKGEQEAKVKKKLKEEVEETKRDWGLIKFITIGVVLFIIYIFRKRFLKFF